MSSLSADVLEALAALARSTPEVEVLVLFGSAATDRLRRDSDVDLYVRVLRGSELERRAFTARASSIARREVDLHIEAPSTSVILRREVAARGRVLFERAPGAHRDLVADAIRAYLDFEPELRKLGAVVRARARREGLEASARLRVRGAPSGR